MPRRAESGRWSKFVHSPGISGSFETGWAFQAERYWSEAMPRRHQCENRPRDKLKGAGCIFPIPAMGCLLLSARSLSPHLRSHKIILRRPPRGTRPRRSRKKVVGSVNRWAKVCGRRKATLSISKSGQRSAKMPPDIRLNGLFALSYGIPTGRNFLPWPAIRCSCSAY